MDKNEELERGIIPAGTRIKLYKGSITLLEDTLVDANQEWIDKAIQDQKDFYNGIGRIGAKALERISGCAERGDLKATPYLNSDFLQAQANGAKTIETLLQLANLSKTQLEEVKIYLNPASIHHLKN